MGGRGNGCMYIKDWFEPGFPSSFEVASLTWLVILMFSFAPPVILAKLCLWGYKECTQNIKGCLLEDLKSKVKHIRELYWSNSSAWKLRGCALNLIDEALCPFFTLITNGFGFYSILSISCGLVHIFLVTYSSKIRWSFVRGGGW